MNKWVHRDTNTCIYPCCTHMCTELPTYALQTHACECTCATSNMRVQVRVFTSVYSFTHVKFQMYLRKCGKQNYRCLMYIASAYQRSFMCRQPHIHTHVYAHRWCKLANKRAHPQICLLEPMYSEPYNPLGAWGWGV